MALLAASLAALTACDVWGCVGMSSRARDRGLVLRVGLCGVVSSHTHEIKGGVVEVRRPCVGGGETSRVTCHNEVLGILSSKKCVTNY